MTDDQHQRVREMLGGYVLGHLTPDETDRVRAHLDGCAECRADLAEISPVVPGLAAVDPDLFATQAAPPPELGARIRAAVADERAAREDQRRDVVHLRAARRRRRTTGLVAAAAAIVVVALGGGIGIGRLTAPEPAGPPMEPVAMQVVGDPNVSVTAANLVNHTWGTELRISAVGFTAGEVYRASFRESDGTMDPAGEFVGVGAAAMVCNLQSSVLRSEVTEVVVTDADGDTVLRAAL